eukprot:TRINITY_DN26586_c0_g1_i1.p1 TRINITY_DN26586_c0_g1~~TRINITY_DN26586_c0_g1_i1.p1  ORF type:complete len:353 (+),score=86.06 TRINITY_DN26586_c0_g1_i1:134-1192(+)
MAFAVAASLAVSVPAAVTVSGSISKPRLGRVQQSQKSSILPQSFSCRRDQLKSALVDSLLFGSSADFSRRREQLRRFEGSAQAVSEEAAEAELKNAEGEEDDDLEDSNGAAVPTDHNQPPADFPPVTSSPEDLVAWLKTKFESDDTESVQQFASYITMVSKETEYLAQQVTSMTEEVALSKDRFLRLNADFDNFRKRAEREKQNMGQTATADVIEKLLPMVDNFERAKGAIKIETEGEQKIDVSYQGIYKQFVEVMKALGVSAVETVGKEFDPNVHEAIMREDSDLYHEGVVMLEFRKGFTIGEKLLRPAMVKVSSGPGPANSSPPSSVDATPSVIDSESETFPSEEPAAAE